MPFGWERTTPFVNSNWKFPFKSKAWTLLLPVSATYTLPVLETATPLGFDNWPLGPGVVPHEIMGDPPPLSFWILLLPESATKRPPPVAARPAGFSRVPPAFKWP